MKVLSCRHILKQTLRTKRSSVVAKCILEMFLYVHMHVFSCTASKSCSQFLSTSCSQTVDIFRFDHWMGVES